MALVLPDGDEVLKITFEVRGQKESMTVTLAPEAFGTVLASMQWMQQAGLWHMIADEQGNERPDDLSSVGLANYQLIQRIKDWEGPVTADGAKVPCTKENKLLFFGRFPNALPEIWTELERLGKEQRKNSKPSRRG